MNETTKFRLLSVAFASATVIASVASIGWYSADQTNGNLRDRLRNVSADNRSLRTQNEGLAIDISDLKGRNAELRSVNNGLLVQVAALGQRNGTTQNKLVNTRSSLQNEKLRREGAERTAQKAVVQASKLVKK